MKRILVASMLSLACLSAYATNKPQPKPVNHGPSKPVPAAVAGAAAVGVGVSRSVSTSNARSDASSDSRSASNSVATGGIAAATGGDGSATSSSAGGSAQNGNQSMVVNNVNPDDVKIRNVPSVNAWAAAPSATCVVTTGGSVNVPGFGGGLSTGTIDKGCEARENARFLSSLGATMEAVRVLCRAQPDVAAEMEDCKDIHDEHVKRANEKARGVNPANQFNVSN